MSHENQVICIYLYMHFMLESRTKNNLSKQIDHTSKTKRSHLLYIRCYFIYFTSIKHRQSANRVNFHSRRIHRTHQVATIVKLMMWHTALNYGETIYYIHIRVLCIWPNNESLIMCYMCSVVVCVQLKSQTNTSRALAVYHSFFI